MTEGNYYLRDITLNATIIDEKVRKGREVLLGQKPRLTSKRALSERSELDAELIEAITRCENIRFMADKMEQTAHAAIETAAENYLRILLESAPLKHRPIVCVFAPMFDESNVADGYYRRIRNIDALFPSRTLRVHFYPNPQSPWASVTLVDDDHIVISYEQGQQIASLFKLVNEKARFIYCHSIHCFDFDLLEDQSNKIVLDFHGAVPEETRILCEDNEKAARLAVIEKRAIAQSSTVIAVTNAMVTHIKNKYPEESMNANYIVMPIFDIDGTNVEPTAKAECELPTTIYAGGTQAWQLFDEMIDAVESQPSLCSYRFFLPNPAAFNETWRAKTSRAAFTIATKSPDDLREEYLKSDFGFILRDDSTVNKVACPTKLIEYLVYGVIPIVKSTQIGDFSNDGMAYVLLEDFRAGRLPSADERQTMRKTNYQVIASQVERFTSGRNSLLAFFDQLLA